MPGEQEEVRGFDWAEVQAVALEYERALEDVGRGGRDGPNDGVGFEGQLNL